MTNAIREARAKFETHPRQGAEVKKLLMQYFDASNSNDTLSYKYVNCQTLFSGETALHLALRAGYKACANYLLFELKASPDIIDNAGVSAYQIMVQRGYVDLLDSIGTFPLKVRSSLLKEASKRLNSNDHLKTLKMIKLFISKEFTFENDASYSELRSRLENVKRKHLSTEDSAEIIPLINSALAYVEEQFPSELEDKIAKASNNLRKNFR